MSTTASTSQRQQTSRASSLSMLSPFQVEKAQFTPGKPLEFTPQYTMAPLSSVSVASSPVSQRLERQEARLRDLEEDIKRLQQCYDTRSQASPGCAYPTKPIADLLSMDVDEDDGADNAVTSSNLRALAEVYTPPLSNHSSTVVTASAEEDDPHYQADNFDAFESLLNGTNSRHIPPAINTTPAAMTNEDSCATLLEGIGSPAEITLHRNIEDQETRQAAHPKPQPWDGSISWKVGTSQFGGENEEGSVVTLSGQIYPKILDAGVVFVPSGRDDNVYRTVTLHNLPLNIKMKTLFKGILGGEVYSAHLMNTKDVAGSHLGIVTFVNEEAASAYAQFSVKHGVYFNNQRARISLLKTSTYPMTADMVSKIFKQGYTRCLSIRGPADSSRYDYILNHIQTRLPMYFNLGESIIEDDAETEIIIRMNSIKAACGIMDSLKALTCLNDCEFDFAADPCAEPLPRGKSTKNQGKVHRRTKWLSGR